MIQQQKRLCRVILKKIGIYSKRKIEKIYQYPEISIVFGKENDMFAIDNSSLILSKYGLRNYLGSFGVIGPIRLDYKKVVPYVSYFSESVSRIIDHMMQDGLKGEIPDGETNDQT